MKTVKDVSEITRVSIRTLRYYDEIGLLKPTKLTDSGYRLYDHKALEKLQEIMFFRELEIPLMDIKRIMENPIVNDIRNFAFGLAKASAYGFGKSRKQKFIMSFTIITIKDKCY